MPRLPAALAAAGCRLGGAHLALVSTIALLAACADPVAPTSRGARPMAASAASQSRLPLPTRPATLLDVGGFRGWELLAEGTFDSGPAVGDALVVARGTDGRIYATAGGADSWHAIGDGATSRPAITSFPVELKCDHAPKYPREEECPRYQYSGEALAVRREDGNIWVMTRTTTAIDDAWYPWQRLPAGVFGAPAITYALPYLYVFARARDGTLQWSRAGLISADARVYGAWSSWATVPGATITSDPAVLGTDWLQSRTAPPPYATVHIIATRADGRIWRNRMEDRGTFVFSGWRALPGGPTIDTPAIGGHPERTMVIASRGFDDAVWLSSSDDGGATWAPFRRVDAVTTSPPAVDADAAPDHVSVYARGTDGRIYRNPNDRD